MATYPIKMLKDEQNIPFVPLTSTEGIQDPNGYTLEQRLATKLGPANLHGGTNISVRTVGDQCYIDLDLPSSLTIINNLTTATAGQGALDAYQGKVLKDMIDNLPTVVDDITSTSSTNALSANQGYILNNKFNNYLPLTGTASSANYPAGFSLKTDSQGWGNQDGTFLTGWMTSPNSAEIAFRDNSGQLNVIIDGFLYQNEGNNRVLDKTNLAGASLYGSGDSIIQYNDRWLATIYTNLNNLTTSDSSIFSYESNGIKVKKSGYYLIYCTMNLDYTGTLSGIIMINGSTSVIHDVQGGGMINATSAVEIRQLNANDIINIGFRLDSTGSFLTRGVRSCLTVLKIA